MSEFLAFLKAIPTLISLFNKLSEFIEKVLGRDLEGWLKDLHALDRKFDEAVTDDQKLEAMRAIQSLYKRI